MSMVLLSRSAFKAAVFKRDKYRCIICHNEGILDAHHIIERKLWNDGGYYVDNGVSLCSECHLKAESTEISCTELRYSANIKNVILPDHFDINQDYDKWGNPILPNGKRLKGELYQDISVQKVLLPFSHLFVDKVKYPRTPHLPFSPGKTSDDKVISNLSKLKSSTIVATIKMDGECTTMYADGLHARSLEYEGHESRSWVKSLQARIGPDIPKGWRICGENLWAKHSIKYNNLQNYFLVFSIWNDQNICLSWDDTIEWSKLLGLSLVPVIYVGPWDEGVIQKLYRPIVDGDLCEGYVIRVVDSFSYRNFRTNVAKYVRANHLQSTSHNWMHQNVERNCLKTM